MQVKNPLFRFVTLGCVAVLALLSASAESRAEFRLDLGVAPASLSIDEKSTVPSASYESKLSQQVRIGWDEVPDFDSTGGWSFYASYMSIQVDTVQDPSRTTPAPAVGNAWGLHVGAGRWIGIGHENEFAVRLSVGRRRFPLLRATTGGLAWNNSNLTTGRADFCKNVPRADSDDPFEACFFYERSFGGDYSYYDLNAYGLHADYDVWRGEAAALGLGVFFRRARAAAPGLTQTITEPGIEMILRF